VRHRRHAGCRVAAERAADHYTLICDGPVNLTFMALSEFYEETTLTGILQTRFRSCRSTEDEYPQVCSDDRVMRDLSSAFGLLR
jgi:hypothetical protein